MLTLSPFTHEAHHKWSLDQTGNIAYTEPGGGWFDVNYIGILIEPTRLWLKVNLTKSTCTTRYNHYTEQSTLALFPLVRAP